MKKIITITIILVLLPLTLFAEPWYYTNDSKFVSQQPDKVVHYVGSYFLSEVTNPKISIILGILWEVKQKSQGGEFGEKDLLLDLLGSYQIGFVNFNKRKEYWTFNLIIPFGV